MLSIKEIKENLLDACCNSEEKEAILSCISSGDTKKATKLIASLRKRQLEVIHERQRYIDRLDYLEYQIGK